MRRFTQLFGFDPNTPWGAIVTSSATNETAKALHLKCERGEDGKLKGLSYDAATGHYLSGWWNVTDKEAEALVGGWLYLHQLGIGDAEIGGKVVSFEKLAVSGRSNEARVVFTVDYSPPCRNQPWRGLGLFDRKIWNGGLVQASLPHELT